MFEPQITIPQWLELPRNIRLRLVEIFSIPRSRGTEVLDNQIVCDGHDHADLKVVTVEKMKEFTGKDGDFYTLFNETVSKIVDELSQAKENEIKQAEAEAERLQEEKSNALKEAVETIEKVAGSMKKKKV